MAKVQNSEKRKLSHDAYGGVHGSEYIPFVPADKALPELTAVAVIVGSLFAILFAAANAYLGLKAGMTISAAIPAAVLATALLKGVFRRNSILESNLVMAIAATGESLAGGIIFTLPAIILWGFKDQFTLIRIVFVVLVGGFLGALFVIPLRRYLTVEEHGKLIYPEGMAAAEVLVTSNQGGTGFMTVLSGMLVGGIYKLLSGGFGIWSEDPSWVIKRFESTEVGVNVLASLMGVGFIVGLDIALYMLAGSVLAWLGLIPLIKFFGAGLTTPVYPATDLIKDMSAGAIWSKYVRYIGAGGVLAGGFISLIKALPTIIKAFRESIVGIGMKGKDIKRTDIDVSLTWVIFGAAFVFFVAWLIPSLGVTALGSLLAVLFAFFFAVVSARITGLVGVSNNPVSGMTIATLLIVTSVLKLVGVVGNEGMVIAITIGGIVCVASAIAGANAQSLKTTFIIGGTPKYIEIFTYIGIIAASVFAGLVLILLNNAYGFGSKDIPAPQATIMSMVVKGIMTGDLPWTFIIAGVFMGIMAEMMHVPVLPFALGLYLPFELSAAIAFGGIIRWLVDQRYRKNEKLQKEKVEKGILIASGLVAGDALMGLVIAAFVALKINIDFASNWITNTSSFAPWFSLIMFLLVGLFLYLYTCKNDKEEV